ncbi:MAG: transposase [bacterium]
MSIPENLPVGGALCAATPPHSADLRRNRISLPIHMYHVTKRLDKHVASTLNLTCFGKILVAAFVHQRNRHNCRLFAFVVMPDHIHWLFAIPEAGSLSERVKVTFNWSSVQINRACSRHGPLWQDGFYDHLLREDEPIAGLIDYIEANPVRKCLCEFPGDWEWSSAYPALQNGLDRDWLSFHRFK